MMEFYTSIRLPKPAFMFDYADNILLMGSCFAENIGKRLAENKYQVDINPFGTLYNPASVEQGLKMLIKQKHVGEDELFAHEGVYHSFSHHSRFSAPTKEGCLSAINERLEQSSESLLKATRLVVTFGTAYVYRLKSNGSVVANCHKLPEKMFVRERLSVDTIVTEWKALLLSLWEHNPELKVLFTVSPIRHWKDGAHANQLSKATLLLAVEALLAEYPEQTDYFAAYELMMDELRDYRFYAEDMLHPSAQAIDYIWERFAANNISKHSLSVLNEWKELKKAIDHRPFQPDSDAYRRFIHQTLLKAEQLKNKMPSFDIEKEIALLQSKLSDK